MRARRRIFLTGNCIKNHVHSTNLSGCEVVAGINAVDVAMYCRLAEM